MKALLTLVILISCSRAGAFVENVTHGYPNCMACHVSPTGGGLLTDYGRALSSELMSTIKTKDINGPFFGLVKNSPHIKWGGDMRVIQTRFENNQIKTGSLFVMQQNIEVAAYLNEFTAVATFGRKEGPKNRTVDIGEFISERHYLMYSPDPTTKVRVGKFRQSYGLNDPNHTRFVKRELGFGSYSENYQLEYFKVLESGEFLLSTSLGRIDLPKDPSERNIMGQWTKYIDGSGRLSANVLLGESSRVRRSLLGVNGILPLFSTHDFLRFDINYQVSKNLLSNNNEEKGIYGYLIWGHRFFDGLLPYVVYEHKQDDLEKGRLSMTNSPGLGIQFFPLSHFEIQLEHQYRIAQRAKDNPEHRSLLLMHVYY